MAIKTSVGVSYRQQNIDDQWDAIVVGSGIGGLTTAALLSKYAGKKVLVLERHYTAGGYTHSFHRPGYEWDVGVHYVGQLQDPNSPVRHAFDAITDGSLEWSPMPDVYDRVIIGERTYDFVTGRERFRERMKEYFPREARAIDRYIGAVESAAKWSGLYFAEKAIPRPLAWALGGIMRAPFRRWSDRTTADVLQRITSNAELAGVLTAQWGDYGLPPKQSSFGVHAIIAQHYFEGASYPVGGASRIAAAIAPAIERNGGQVVTSAEVSELLLDRGRAIGVRMSDGRELRAPVVVSDAGARNTFDNLVREPNQGVLHAITELCAVPASMAHLSLYVGVKAAAAELGLNGTNLWVYPGYDHDRNVENFRQNPAGPFPVIYISFPSAKDPDFEQRHPGRATIEVVTPMPYQYFEQWQDTRWKRRGEDYDAFKEQLTQRLKAELERVVPAVAGKIDHAELSTPVTTRHFMNYQRGEAYGLAATPKRFALGCLSAQTPIPGLYLAGQDVTSLGVTGALFGGGVSASAILGRNLVSAISNKATARPVRAPEPSARRPATV
jgi:all-trans-retinol 13,14-reductase